ncbi:hypothetical protein AVEN_134498-1 [Araneus ventricosus]|uniref:Uncharacterized protein n=1 Tax=Araneus ventricosus TaxID=182803 RepID=A0A4Y2UIL7_ARAVE|nr:hypothetical protein AVEN_134498-1 [Araneus ventricosus]
MVDKNSIDVAVKTITDCIIISADISIPKTSGNIPKLYKPWWNAECATCQKALEKAWCEESVHFLSSYTEDYNSTFSYRELKNALRKSNPTSPGSDEIHKDMLKHLDAVREGCSRNDSTPPNTEAQAHLVPPPSNPIPWHSIERDKNPSLNPYVLV